MIRKNNTLFSLLQSVQRLEGAESFKKRLVGASLVKAITEAQESETLPNVVRVYLDQSIIQYLENPNSYKDLCEESSKLVSKISSDSEVHQVINDYNKRIANKPNILKALGGALFEAYMNHSEYRSQQEEDILNEEEMFISKALSEKNRVARY